MEDVDFVDYKCKWDNVRDMYRHDYHCLFCNKRLIEYHKEYLYCKACKRVYGKKDFIDRYLEFKLIG